MEILTQHFSEEEIKSIEALPDYEEIKTKIEQIQAESLLDELSLRVKEGIAHAKTLEEKIRVFKESLGLEGVSWNQNEVPAENTWSEGIDFSTLSLSEIEKKAKEWIQGAQEYLDEKKDKLVVAGEEKFRSWIKESFLWKILPEKFINWIVDTGKEKAQWKLEGIWWAIKWWIVWFLIWVIPWGKLLMNWYEKIFWDSEDGNEEVETIPDESDSLWNEVEWDKRDWTNDILTENIEIEKISKARVAWYFLLSQISGFPIQKNSPQMWILDTIDKQNPPISLVALRGYLTQWELKKRLWLENTNYAEEDIFQVVLWMVWPINEEFFSEQLSPEAIKTILGQDPKYTDLARQFFTTEERKMIEKNKYEYQLLSVGILARLSILSIKKQLAWVASLPGSYARKFSELFGNVIASDEFRSLTESQEYPRGVSIAFEAILLESTDKNAETLIINAEKKLNTLWQSISEEEKQMIHDIVSYKAKIMSEIGIYSLGTHGFEAFMQNRTSWGDILMLYTLMQGKSIQEANGFEQMLIYTWIYGILDSSMKWKYQAQIATQLLENKNENNSKVLSVLILRIIELDRNIFIDSLEKTKWTMDETVGWVTGLNEIENDWIRNTLINLSEIGLFSLALKILGKTPIFRAVMIASTGVVWATIILWIKEKLYQDQSSIVWKYYIDFLKEVSPYMGYEDYNVLIADVESGKLSSGEILKKAASTPESAIENIMWKLFPNS